MAAAVPVFPGKSIKKAFSAITGMLKRIYLDSNIYLDYFLGRANGRRPLGEFAFSIFKRTFACEFEIIVSGWVVEEVKKTSKHKEMGILLTQLRQVKKVREIQVSLDDEKQAGALYKETGVHFADAVHYILAVRSGAEMSETQTVSEHAQKPQVFDILVSNDKHMQNLPEVELKIRDCHTIDL